MMNTVGPGASAGVAAGLHDVKRKVLGADYDPAHPVRNWLLYKFSGADCDALALADDLAALNAAGFLASPDSMHSFWMTYKRAIALWYGQTFTLHHKTHNLRRLLDLHDRGEFAEVNALFATFATLAHVRGNFMLVPVYVDARTGRQSARTNLNIVRSGAASDYWDLTLAGIQSGRFDAFFGENPVAPAFDITAMPGGFTQFVEQHRLEMYLDEAGSVRPLWTGHLDPGAKVLPQTRAHVEQFLENACALILQRTAALER